MIRERSALLRQAQEYFRMLLLGVVDWDDVHVDKAIPVSPVRGNRDQGKTRDLVIANFNGFRMELMGPFEDHEWPLGKIKVSKGNGFVQGHLDASTWLHVATFIKQQKTQGEDHGSSIAAGADWGR
jgi:hypothetical protein